MTKRSGARRIRTFGEHRDTPISCQASLSHPAFPIVSVNGQRQSGGHWNVAFGLLGTSIGLPGFSAGGWWCVGGRGALSGSGVQGVSGSPFVMCKIVFNNRNSAAGGAAPSEEQTTMGRVVPPHSYSLNRFYNPCVSGNCSLVHRM